MILIRALLKKNFTNRQTVKTFKNRDLLKQMMVFMLGSYLILCQTLSYAEKSTPSPEAQGNPSFTQQISDVSETPASEASIPETQKTKETEKASFLLDAKGGLWGVPPFVFFPHLELSLGMQAPVIIDDNPLKLLIQGGAGGVAVCSFVESADGDKLFNSGSDYCFSNIIPYFRVDAGLSYVSPFWATIISLKGGLLGIYLPPIVLEEKEEERFGMFPSATLSLGWKIDDIFIELNASLYYSSREKEDPYGLIPSLSVSFPLKKW